MTAENTPISESRKYEEMLVQVEKIITDLSSQSVSLDEMVEKVEIGYDLIAAMKKRLDDTRAKIEKLNSEHQMDQPN